MSNIPTLDDLENQIILLEKDKEGLEAEVARQRTELSAWSSKSLEYAAKVKKGAGR